MSTITNAEKETTITLKDGSVKTLRGKSLKILNILTYKEEEYYQYGGIDDDRYKDVFLSIRTKAGDVVLTEEERKTIVDKFIDMIQTGNILVEEESDYDKNASYTSIPAITCTEFSGESKSVVTLQIQKDIIRIDQTFVQEGSRLRAESRISVAMSGVSNYAAQQMCKTVGQLAVDHYKNLGYN